MRKIYRPQQIMAAGSCCPMGADNGIASEDMVKYAAYGGLGLAFVALAVAIIK
jgi:hypothetical protein